MSEINSILYITGKVRDGIYVRTKWMLDSLAELAKCPAPVQPPLKVFKPKCTELPVLKSYHFGAPDSYWEKFPKFRNIHSKSPYQLDADLLKALSIKVGVRDMKTVNWVCQNIKTGCNLNVDSSICMPSRSSNAPSARKMGVRVMDSIGQWIKDRIVVGPFDTAPTNAIVSGIMTKMKPTGAVRIIINQSSPKDRSINDCLIEEYPVQMDGIREFVQALNYCGRDSVIWKADWNNAYKHFWVREEDLRYNWFCFLDKYFCELCLGMEQLECY